MKRNVKSLEEELAETAAMLEEKKNGEAEWKEIK